MSRYYGPGNRIMTFGTAGIAEDGELFLSDMAKCRVHRTAEAWLDPNFNKESGLILISGGYSKELNDNPPVNREARLMAKFLLEQYDTIKEEVVLIEDESTDTEENFLRSQGKHSEFFTDIISGKRKLGLVSHPFHLKRVVDVGRRALGFMDDSWARELETWQLDDELSERAAMEKWRAKLAAASQAADI